MNVYKHTAEVTKTVHDALVSWSKGLLSDAGMEVVDVWGRFPPEGTTRSHLVLFPYRVGPDPKMLDNSAPVSMVVNGEQHTDKVPVEVVDLGHLIYELNREVFPGVAPYDPQKPPEKAYPYPAVTDLPDPIRRWYEERGVGDVENGWLIESGGVRYARPPSLRWRRGVTVGAYYIALAGDPGRGTTSRTSDTAPLSLSALSVLAVGIQKTRTLPVDLPPRPREEVLLSYCDALLEFLGDDPRADALRDYVAALTGTSRGYFFVMPVHDLNNQEFALLTQALQRPLQALLTLRIFIPVGDEILFRPSAAVWTQTGFGN